MTEPNGAPAVVHRPYTVKSYAAPRPSAELQPWDCPRRAPRDDDVRIRIDWNGICHSDVHQVDCDWAPAASWPMVPGHEIIGTVLQAGAEAAAKFRAGDVVGVGCFVDSCRQCAACKDGLRVERCPGAVFTYNSAERGSGEPTYGGYSREIVVRWQFVLRIPPELHDKLPRAAPLLCAGITTYAPLRRAQLKAGQRVAIMGLGGLGHVAVRLAKAMRCEVAVFSRSAGKRATCMALGADKFVVSSDESAMKGERAKYDFVLDTIAAGHDLVPATELLVRGGQLCLVGLPPATALHTVSGDDLTISQKSIFGSFIGGIELTQEMLHFCAQHNVVCDVELIRPSYVNEAFKRLKASDVQYRFVMDSSELDREPA